MKIKREKVQISHHKFNNIQRRLLGFESLNADLQATAEGFLTRLAAFGWQWEGDVAGAAVKSYCPPHLAFPRWIIAPTLKNYRDHPPAIGESVFWWRRIVNLIVELVQLLHSAWSGRILYAVLLFAIPRFIVL